MGSEAEEQLGELTENVSRYSFWTQEMGQTRAFAHFSTEMLFLFARPTSIPCNPFLPSPG